MRTLYVFFLFALLLSSCGKPLQLAFSPPADFAEHYSMQSLSTTNSKVMGMDVVVQMNQQTDYTVQRVAAASQEPLRLRFEYTGFQYSMSTMGNETSYDSAGDPEDNDPNLAKVYGAMLYQPWYITYDQAGQIQNTEGFADLLDGAVTDLPEEARAAMQANFSGEALISTFQAMTSFYPPQPVKVGAEWQVEQEVQLGGMTLHLKTVYTLAGRKNGRAELQLVGDLNTGEKGSTLDMGTMQMTYILSGTQQGTMIVDELTGWPVSSQIEQDLGGSVQMRTEAMGDMTMEMEMDIVQTIGRKADN
jgi:hypothetical protein